MTKSSNSEDEAIAALVDDYFRGIYESDAERLRGIFDPRCWLFGENLNGSHAFPLEGFIEQVGSAPAPKNEGEAFEMQLLSLDRSGPVAVVKLAVRYQGRHYTDYLTLQKTEGQWKVVGKLFYCPD